MHCSHIYSVATDALAKLSTLKDVTRIFWVTSAFELSTAKRCEINGTMFRNVLIPVIPNAHNLCHICLQTGAMHYMGINRSIDVMNSNPAITLTRPFITIDGKFHVIHHDPPFNEDMKRLENIHNFYDTLEDVLFDEISRKPSLTWSVHMPDLIFGFSPYSTLNGQKPFGIVIRTHQMLIWYQSIKFGQQFLRRGKTRHSTLPMAMCSNGNICG
ncbi:hypothetical protein H5410_012075, partial [Solanum commersonii]